MGKKKNKMQTIADILPQDLSEETVNKIAELVQETITSEVKKEIDSLAIKFTSLMRSKIDETKEHALHELELENEDYRNHELMEAVKGAIVLEASPESVDHYTRLQLNEANEVSENSEVLEEQLEEVVKDNNQLKNTLTILERKLKNVEKEKQRLQIQLEHKTNDVQETRLVGKAKVDSKAVDTVAKGSVISEQYDNDLGLDLSELRRLANLS